MKIKLIIAVISIMATTTTYAKSNIQSRIVAGYSVLDPEFEIFENRAEESMSFNGKYQIITNADKKFNIVFDAGIEYRKLRFDNNFYKLNYQSVMAMGDIMPRINFDIEDAINFELETGFTVYYHLYSEVESNLIYEEEDNENASPLSSIEFNAKAGFSFAILNWTEQVRFGLYYSIPLNSTLSYPETILGDQDLKIYQLNFNISFVFDNLLFYPVEE